MSNDQQTPHPLNAALAAAHAKQRANAIRLLARIGHSGAAEAVLRHDAIDPRKLDR